MIPPNDPFGFTTRTSRRSPAPAVIVARPGQEMRIIVPDASGHLPPFATCYSSGNPSPRNSGDSSGNPSPRNSGDSSGNPRPRNSGDSSGNPSPRNSGDEGSRDPFGFRISPRTPAS